MNAMTICLKSSPQEQAQCLIVFCDQQSHQRLS
jgi:hypothetical protein